MATELNEAPYEVMYGPCEAWIHATPDEVQPADVIQENHASQI